MKTVIVTINVDTNGDARPTLEHIEGLEFADYDAIIKELESNSIERENIEIMTISDFMDRYNNDELNTTETFMGYVKIN